MIMNTAPTRKKLENVIFRENAIAQKHNCQLRRLDYRQEEGLFSCVPLGYDQIKLKRSMNTTATAVFIPFTTQELFHGGESLYYGTNALSGNMIMCDRKQLKNPNGAYLGKPGSGKSFAIKREITNVFLVTPDDIIICDPESEYGKLVVALGGQVIKISPTSGHYINPLDINLENADSENPLVMKAGFLMSFCELILGKNGLEADEKSIIDRCIFEVYKPYCADPANTPMPILEDLWNIIRVDPHPSAQRIALALEIYVKGSLKIFNNRTNVDINNRIVCFDTKELGPHLQSVGMLIVQDCVWTKVSANRDTHKSTRYYIDEFHLLLKVAQTAEYSIEIFKRFRKWGGIPTVITQNASDMLSSKDIGVIYENSEFVCLLDQAEGDREILAKKLRLSPQQLKFVTGAEQGEGLISYGGTIVPFIDRFPKNTQLYKLMTTKHNEKSEVIKEKKQFEKRSEGGEQ